MDINILLFDDFETLDVFGPVEILGQIEEDILNYFSKSGGTVKSAQGLIIITEPILDANKNGILLIPGGRGTRVLVNDTGFLDLLYELSERAHFCLSICTGSALLGKCGALCNKKATSNKNAMDWVKSVNEQVDWIEKARWVVDDKFYTSSGVSAGMDMVLGFVSDRFGRSRAEEIANHIEYIWNNDCMDDRFAKE